LKCAQSIPGAMLSFNVACRGFSSHSYAIKKSKQTNIRKIRNFKESKKKKSEIREVEDIPVKI